LAVLAGFVECQSGSGFASTRRITDHAGEIADDEDGLVAQILELAKLAEHNRVTEMEVGPAGVTTELHAERLVGLDGSLKLPNEVLFRNDLRGPSFDEVHLFVDGRKQSLAASPLSAWNV
jgi:hypothetical protein